MRDPDRQPDLPYLSGLPRPRRADINAVSGVNGTTYLHELCRRDAPLVLIDDAVRKLGADINRKNKEGLPPLGIALMQGSPVLVRRLLELGASIEAGDFNALLYAVDGNKPEMLFVLLRHGAGPALNRGGLLTTGRVTESGPLLVAADNRRTEFYAPLISAGAFVNATRPDDRQTALHIAAGGSDDRAVPILLSRGADPNVRADAQWSPLHVAATRDRSENIDALLRAGADLEAENMYGQTALMLAVEHNNINCVKALLEAGADINHAASGMEMRTPLMIAARKANTVLVDVLLEAGADPLLQDRRNETAAQQVTRNIHTDLYKRLKDHEDTRLRESFEKAHRRLTTPANDRNLPPARRWPQGPR